MADSTAIVTNSMANLTVDMVEQYQISIVPIMLLIQGKLYRDGVDISPSEAYQLFLQDPERFNTSPSSPGQ
ncbi:DegV family protein [Chloroflexota bacterium]